MLAVYTVMTFWQSAATEIMPIKAEGSEHRSEGDQIVGSREQRTVSHFLRHESLVSFKQNLRLSVLEFDSF